MTTRPLPAVDSLSADLATWLPEQRWFAAKGRAVGGVRVERVAVVIDGDPALVHVLLDADGERYQLLLGVGAEVPEHLRGSVIGRLDDGSRAYDAAHDAELMSRLPELFAAHSQAGGLDWQPEPGVRIPIGQRARPIGVEQSNTSIVFGEHFILKLYRRPAPGRNRDVDLHRALARAGSGQVAEPVAVLSNENTVLGFAQRFLGDAAEGWATATASVRGLLAEADVTGVEVSAGEAGGDFAGEAHRLGAAVAHVHADLATALGTGSVDAAAMADGADEMHGRLDALLTEVPELAAHEATLRAAFDAVRDLPATRVQHTHGDLHLGQVLRTTAGWVLIDFEGEPDAPVTERGRTRSPLRDVAGMLRSFDYAALHLLAGEDPDEQRLARAAQWADRNRAAFCDGYATVGQDPRAESALLRAFELDKAVYEVGYEHRNRPDWLPIPLAAINRVTATR
ncbi:maltokinase N-terminal cap-like domain-containing protein [Actinokineospora inagensis]|uniref:maltokinase N-terminal cap-like domain-containing protein n=1 Tax=Actinokineospora inagensis TaxID=103730 RepID=UPI00041D3D8C|nr:aminoglycoside phosphotransferase [Actinokineospora inagensis]